MQKLLDQVGFSKLEEKSLCKFLGKFSNFNKQNLTFFQYFRQLFDE